MTTDELELRVDGSRSLSAETVRDAALVCDRAEDHAGLGAVLLHVTGAPGASWASTLELPLVTRWERTLRRLERLPMATIAVAAGDCGGTALDVLLAADVRIGSPDTRLILPTDGATIWPGLTVYRLVNQAGLARVRGAVLFGSAITAEEAVACALLDEMTEDPGSAIAAVAGRCGAYSGPELAIRRQLAFDAVTTSFEEALGTHLAACDRMLRQRAQVGS